MKIRTITMRIWKSLRTFFLKRKRPFKRFRISRRR